MPKKLRHLATCIVISSLAAACGGGSGGGEANVSDTPTAPTPPISPDPVDPAPLDTFTLSGAISTPASQLVDSDTNDPNKLAISNDDPSQAQPIPNPITLGGYVNVPGAGASGRSALSGDIDDFFQVDLLAGQSVTLLVADFEQADADLYLIDSDGVQVENSLNTGEVESLLVPEDGTYFVVINAYEGATNYILAIGDTLGQPAQRAHRVIPWETVVTYKNDTQQLSSGLHTEEVSRGLGMQQRAGGRGRGRLMAMRKNLSRSAKVSLQPASWASNIGMINNSTLSARTETLLAIKALRKDSRVLYAEPNYRITALAAPNDRAYPLQWNYPLIAMPDAWEISTGKSEVIVAVIDTGILPRHPDLTGQLVAGYDFVSNIESAQDGDGIDPDPRDPGSSVGSRASNFHGTHVAGIVAARGNNRIGVAGSAYGSRIMPLRALGTDGEGTSYDLRQALRYAAGLPNDSGTVPQKPVDIINLSLGGEPFSQATQALYNEVRTAGVIVVAAAGNEASSLPGFPASYDGVISVSAVDGQRRLTTYSNIGPDIDVGAPGGDNNIDLNGDGYPDGILSTDGSINENGLDYVYTFLSGTSMAAPQVAGIIALMKSVNPTLRPIDIDALLASGALTDDVGAPGRDNRFGYGIINAQRSVLAALEAVGSNPADRPLLTASTSTLNFGNETTALTILLRNGGKGDLQVESLSVSAPWLEIVAAEVDSNGLGEYEVIVDRTNLSPGVYAADITIQSSENNLAVRILAAEGGINTGLDLGVIYILLYDPLRDDVIAQTSAQSNQADYPFQFPDVPAGSYEIIAGTDTDNDLFICDAGEACGAWLTTDQPIQIEVNSDLKDLNFPVGYLVSIPAANTVKQSGLHKGRVKVSRNNDKGRDKKRVPKAE
ncbi:MAG: S8 family serine peptidase [Halioglobus sp.]|nr:S8 family serine peptidase [Halioglobus sp.]